MSHRSTFVVTTARNLNALHGLVPGGIVPALLRCARTGHRSGADLSSLRRPSRTHRRHELLMFSCGFVLERCCRT